MTKHLRRVLITTAAAGLVALPALVSGAASASTPIQATMPAHARTPAVSKVSTGEGPVEYWRYAVVDKVVTKAYVAKNKVLGSCSAGTTGIQCSIDKTVGVSSSIGVAFGVSASSVSEQLTGSWESEKTIQVSCTSPVLHKGQTFTAYAKGTRFTYKLVKYPGPYGTPSVPTSTSGTLTAFEANSTAIYCEVS